MRGRFLGPSITSPEPNCQDLKDKQKECVRIFRKSQAKQRGFKILVGGGRERLTGQSRFADLLCADHDHHRKLGVQLLQSLFRQAFQVRERKLESRALICKILLVGVIPPCIRWRYPAGGNPMTQISPHIKRFLHLAIFLPSRHFIAIISP